jgi:hypothetical protein
MYIFGEAVVIAAIIALIGSVATAILKVFFDWMSKKQAHILGISAQRQAYIQRISEKMIDRVHEYAAKYYFPLLKRADDFKHYLKKKEIGNDEIKKRSFFRFIMYIQAEHKLFDEIGGVLLNSFDLEKKVTAFMYIIEKKINLDLKDISFLITKVNVVEYDSFVNLKLEHANNIRLWDDIYKKYERNISDKETREDLIKSLIAFDEIFSYGINIVFYPWYGEKPEPSDEGKKILQEYGITLNSIPFLLR